MLGSRLVILKLREGEGHKKLKKLINTKLVFGGGSDISLSAG